ncbi:CCC motif membrane protein [Robiginitalea aurantiaca]|uniref:CCC motif membrane protein n=1 Tax=Robiginitalea aurantiaca TaxID=3056915 RepID=A0ABT7WCW4_9FLAO|nr:CCC motif membrane protein [Robiginitalea aurantiaca]MDM9630749.1 CCC motif membrane protein [Robiginitalea aurantiaca]
MTQEPLPGASTAQTMGILCLVGTLLCCGPFGAIFGIIGLNNASKAEALYREEPERYSGYENIRSARILSYIGIGLSLLMLIFYILFGGVILALITTGNMN